MVGVQETEESRRNELNKSVLATSHMVCRQRRRYASQNCYWGQIMGESLPTQVKAYFNAMETFQFTLNKKV
jgi:hypothetical protein